MLGGRSGCTMPSLGRAGLLCPIGAPPRSQHRVSGVSCSPPLGCGLGGCLPRKGACAMVHVWQSSAVPTDGYWRAGHFSDAPSNPSLVGQPVVRWPLPISGESKRWGAVWDAPCPHWVGLGFSAHLVHPAVPARRKRCKRSSQPHHKWFTRRSGPRTSPTRPFDEIGGRCGVPWGYCSMGWGNCAWSLHRFTDQCCGWQPPPEVGRVSAQALP